MSLVVILAAFVAGEAEADAPRPPPSLVARGTLRVGVKCDAPPAGYINEKGFAGIDIDFARRIAEVAFGNPAKAEFTCVTAATRVQMLTAGKVDLLLATMGVTEERKKAVDFATSMNWGSSGVLVRAGDAAHRLEDFRGKTLLTTKGAWQVPYLEKTFPDISLVKYDNVNDAIQSLRQGRGDGVTQDRHSLMVAASRDPRLRVTDIQYLVGWSAPALRRGDTELRLFVNAMVEQAKRDGTFKASVERHSDGGDLEERISSYTQLPPDGTSDRNDVLPPP